MVSTILARNAWVKSALFLAVVLFAVVVVFAMITARHHSALASQEQQTQMDDAFMRDDRTTVESLLNTNPSLREQLLQGSYSNIGPYICSAAYYGLPKMTALLLELGADPNMGNSVEPSGPLFESVLRGHESVVALLLSYGAQPNGIYSPTGMTVLHHAVTSQCFHAAIVTELISHGADPNQRAGAPPKDRLLQPVSREKSGKTVPEKGAYIGADWVEGCGPLAIAVADGNVESAKLLLAAGANPNNQSHNGATPLLIAVENKSLPCVDLLLQQGADQTLARHDGMTPLARARELGLTDIVKSLMHQ
jgi:ankyrin repeat protein